MTRQPCVSLSCDDELRGSTAEAVVFAELPPLNQQQTVGMSDCDPFALRRVG